jgi:hypothetical protein
LICMGPGGSRIYLPARREEDSVLKHADDEQQSRQVNAAPSEGFRLISPLDFVAPPQRAPARDRRHASPEGK